MLSMLSALLELVSPIYLASLFSRDSSIFTWNQLLLISSKFWLLFLSLTLPSPPDPKRIRFRKSSRNVNICFKSTNLAQLYASLPNPFRRLTTFYFVSLFLHSSRHILIHLDSGYLDYSQS